MNETYSRIQTKYQKSGENPDTYLKGLLYAKPINYWDYIGVDTLLSLQRPRTSFKDEEIFIMYHQVTELFLKMLLHEIKQLQQLENFSESIWLNKLERMNRYVQMLINSFDIMKTGMDYEDYNTFRHSLAPASGFQSVQFRYIELHCTPLTNLVNMEGKKRLPDFPKTHDYFENLYWKDAGHNRTTNTKTLTLRQFEERYEVELMQLAESLEGGTLYDKVFKLPNLSEKLKRELLTFDKLYNIEWPMVHLGTAQHYLDKKGEQKEATGGSAWKRYLHPTFQQRKFFPFLWKDSN